jgi:hypothetical protein
MPPISWSYDYVEFVCCTGYPFQRFGVVCGVVLLVCSVDAAVMLLFARSELFRRWNKKLETAATDLSAKRSLCDREEVLNGRG